MEGNKVKNRIAQPFGKSKAQTGYTKAQQIGVNYGVPVNVRNAEDKKVDIKSCDNSGQLQAPAAPRRRSMAYIELSPPTSTSPSAMPSNVENFQSGHQNNISKQSVPASKETHQNLPDVVNTGGRKPQLSKQKGVDYDLQPPSTQAVRNSGQTVQTAPLRYAPAYSDNQGSGLDYRNQPKPAIYEYTNSAYEGSANSNRGRRVRPTNQDTSGDRRRSGSQGKENQNRRRSGSQGQDGGNRRRSGSQGQEGGNRRRRSGSQGQDGRRRSGSQGKDQYYRRSSGHGAVDNSNNAQGTYGQRGGSGQRTRSGSQGKEVYGQTIRRRSGSQGKEYVNSHRSSGSVTRDGGSALQSRSWSRGSGVYDRYEDTDTTGDEQMYSGKSQYFYNKQYGTPTSAVDQSRNGRTTPTPAGDYTDTHSQRHRRQRVRPTSNPDMITHAPGPVQNASDNALQNQRAKYTGVEVPQINVPTDTQAKPWPDVQKPPLSQTQPYSQSNDFQLNVQKPFEDPLRVDTAKYNPNSGVIVHGSSNPQTPAQTRRRSYSVCAVLTPESPCTPISPSSVKSTVTIPMLRSRPSSRAASPSPSVFNPLVVPYLNPYLASPGSRSVDGASGYKSDSGMSAYQQQLSPLSSDGGLLSPPPQPSRRGCTPVRVICQQKNQTVQSPNYDDSIVKRGPTLQPAQMSSQSVICEPHDVMVSSTRAISRPTAAKQPQLPSLQAVRQNVALQSQQTQVMYNRYNMPPTDLSTPSVQQRAPQPFETQPNREHLQVVNQQVVQHVPQATEVQPMQLPQVPLSGESDQTNSRRYSEPVNTSAAATTQSSSTFEPRLLMSRRQRRRRSRPLSTCSDENGSRSGSVENLAASGGGQLTAHQLRVQAYNQQQGSLPPLPTHTTQTQPQELVENQPHLPGPTKMSPTKTPDKSPTDWATMTEMEFGKHDAHAASQNSMYSSSQTNGFHLLCPQQNLAPSQQLSSEPEKSPEEQEAAKKAALEAARMRRRRSRELNTLNPEQRQILQQQPLGLQQQVPSSCDHYARPQPLEQPGTHSRSSSGSRQPGQRVRRRARSFNAFTTNDPMAPPPEMSARVRKRPDSAGRSPSTSVLQPTQQSIQPPSSAQQQLPVRPSPPHQPPEPPPRQHYPPPPDYETAVKLSPAPKNLRPMSLPVASTMSSSSDEMTSPDPKHKTRKSQRRRSKEHNKGELDNIDNMLDMALDNLRDAKVSDKQKQMYGNDATEKARNRRRLRRRDWIPDHHAIYQSSEASEAEIDEEYEKVRRTASGLQSPASSSGRNTPFHDEQQLNEEYEKIKRLLGYDKGSESPKLNKQRPMGHAQSCYDVSKVGLSSGPMYRSESSGNLRDEITDLVSPTNENGENVVNDKQPKATPKATQINGHTSLPPLQEEVDGQGRKKKSSKHKIKEHKEGSDMDAFTDAETAPASTQGGVVSPTAGAPAPMTSPSAPTSAQANNEEEEEKPVAPKQKEPTPPPTQIKEASPPLAGKPKESSPQLAEETPPAEGEKKENGTSSKPQSGEITVQQNGTDKPDVKEKEKDTVEENSAEPQKENATEDDSSSTNTTNLPTKSSVISQLKYVYKEDQWSPLNPEGKKLYDRGFLLNLQYAHESTSKPEGLTHLPDIILDAPIRRDERPTGYESKRDFTPGYVIPSVNKPPPRGGGGGGGGGGSGGGGGKRNSQQRNRGGGGPGDQGPQRKVINIPLQMNVNLHQSENAWAPTHKKKADTDEGLSKTESVYKSVTAILNKLTPQKFQTLIQQVLKLDIDTEERLKGSIDIIFEKAIDEPNFSVAYANMAKCMATLKVPSEKDPNEVVLFRNLLLNRCQKEFERDKASEKDMERRLKEIEAATTEEDKKRLKVESDLKTYNDKRRSLGNIRFIGELFKLKMLTEKIMHDCIVRLIKSHDEESLECLCRLMSTIGKDIDKDAKSRQRVDAYFAQLDKVVKLRSTSSRVRFMIQDLMDLRANKWVPRREEGPKTIDAIHKEAQQQEQERQKLVQSLPDQRGMHGQGGRGGGAGNRRGGQAQAMPPVGDDGWHSVGRGKANHIDPIKMKITKDCFDENSIKLGPQGRKNQPLWASGSSGGGGRKDGSGGGSKNASREMDRSDGANAPTNRFSALSSDGASASYDARGGSSRGNRADSRDGKRSSMPRGGARARPSLEQEREAAVAAVRNVMGGPSSRNQSRESSRDGRQGQGRSDSRDSRSARPPTAPVSSAGAEKKSTQSKDEVERKTKSLLEEYLHLHDHSEAIACVQEIDTVNMHLFVYNVINGVLEKTDQGRQMVGNLLHDLVKKNVLTVEQYLQGLVDVLEFAEDMEIDIPRIWQYLGQVIGPMVQDGSVPLNFLRTAVRPLSPQKAGKLLAEVLHDAAARLGHLEVGDQWRQSSLKWEEFLGNDKKNLDDFIQRNKLEFTMGDAEPKSPDGKNLSAEEIQQELDQLIVQQKVQTSEVIDWISRNVGDVPVKKPPFVRALVTAVSRSSLDGNQVHIEKFKARTDLLNRYIDHEPVSELQSLYAVQALVHSLEHPAGVLRSFFDTLYDEEIISEDAFQAWESSTDPAEMAGKGVAINSVKQFFTWLANTEEEAPQ